MKLEEGLRKYENLPRDEYFKANQELAKDLWGKQMLPTVADIAQYVKEGKNDSVQEVFNFFDNKEDFDKMVMKDNRLYEQTESSKFIAKVMASNNKEISESGYLYKLIMASADDYQITSEDCGGKGKAVDLKATKMIEDPEDESETPRTIEAPMFNETYFEFYLKNMYCEEIGGLIEGHFDEFEERYSEILNKTNHVITIRTPLTCNLHKDHTVCRKCCGLLPEKLINIGTFTCLCVTEFATQSALSSMNKGVKKNINQMLSIGYGGDDTWDGIEKWIEENLHGLETSPVQSRFYEIVYLSRVRETTNNKGKTYPFVTSLKNSINYSPNLFGAFIRSCNDKNFRKMMEVGEFEDTSIKLQIATNNFHDMNKLGDKLSVERGEITMEDYLQKYHSEEGELGA